MVVVDIYCRVSTQEQATEGYSLQEQEARLRKFCEAHEWKVRKAFVDGGFSGATMDRPALAEMLEDVRQHAVQKVIVYKLDRLSRSQKDTLHIIEDIMIPNRVDFVSMTETLDTSTAIGIAILGVLSAFAQLERSTIRERMMIGKDAAVKDGKFLHNPNMPFGFDRIEGELRIRPLEAVVVRKVFDLYEQGETMNGICKILSEQYPNIREAEWTIQRVKRILSQPMYVGRQRWHGDEYSVTALEPIITEEQFDRVQQIRERHDLSNQGQTSFRHTSMLGGLVWCGKCGQRFGIKARATKYKYYACYARSFPRFRTDGKICENTIWRQDRLDAIIIAELHKLTFDSFTPKKETPDTTQTLRKELRKLEKSEDRLVDLYLRGSISLSTYDSRRQTIAESIDTLKRQIKDEEAKQQPTDMDAITEYLNELKRLAESDCSPSEYYSIVHELIDRITIDGDQVAIKWRFVG